MFVNEFQISDQPVYLKDSDADNGAPGGHDQNKVDEKSKPARRGLLVHLQRGPTSEREIYNTHSNSI